MIQGEITKERMAGWKFVSSEEPGLHEVIAPGKADCQEVWIYRLNLPAGQRFCLRTDEKEMTGACVRGSARVSWDETGHVCEKLDSFYAVRGMERPISGVLTASFPSVRYIRFTVRESAAGRCL